MKYIASMNLGVRFLLSLVLAAVLGWLVVNRLDWSPWAAYLGLFILVFMVADIRYDTAELSAAFYNRRHNPEGGGEALGLRVILYLVEILLILFLLWLVWRLLAAG
jgi:ABC-type glucose/galactose transport system permease subunit